MPVVEIRNGLIITMDPRRRILKNATIVVEDDKITDIAESSIKAGKINPTKIIDANGRIVLPGFVNCHVHTVQTLFRGIVDGLELLPWLQEYVFPMESAMNAEDVYVSSLTGYAELIKSGTTTCADFQSVRHVDQAFQAAQRIGIRASIAKAMMDSEDVPENLRENTNDSIRVNMQLIKQWNTGNNDRLRSMFGPRSLQSCSPELLTEIGRINTEIRAGVHTHTSENPLEVKKDIAKYGKRPVEALRSFGLVDPTTILAHCIHINSNEIQILSESKANVAHCPSSNLKLASGICNIPKLLQSKVNVTIGVDGAACNNSLDIFKDMKLAALLAKINQQKQTKVSAEEVLEMATIRGAKALGLDGKIGSIEKGKKADLIIMDLRTLETTPTFDVLENLVYAASGHNVQTVIIDGRVVMENQQLTTLNENDLISRAQTRATGIAEKADVDVKNK